MTQFRATVQSAGRWILDNDNQLFALSIAPIAAHTWYNFIGKLDDYSIYFENGILLVPSLSLITILLSALYLSITCIIMFAARKPEARYYSVVPNLLGVPAAFGVYAFGLISPSQTRIVPVYVALVLLSLGAGLVLVTLCYLRRSFSVTPQARKFVQAGPYRFVRHPMYLGNLVTMSGLALLLSTPLAFLIAGLNMALQVLRASYEDRLLAQTFASYGDYAQRVGAFVPRVLALKSGPAIAAIWAAIVLQPLPPVQAALLPRIKSTDSLVQTIATTGPSQCKSWLEKAKAGTWYTQEDVTAFYDLDQSDPAVEKSSSCRDFFKLQEKCQDVAVNLGDESKDVAKILGVLESTPGCKAIIGADLVCRTLEAVGKSGKTLSAKMRPILADCADNSILSNTGSFLRLGE